MSLYALLMYVYKR